MAIKKFKNINIKEKNKVKLSKEEKKAEKEKKKAEKKELKDIRKENKKVLATTKNLLDFIDVDDDGFIAVSSEVKSESKNIDLSRCNYINIYQIDSKDIFSLSEEERKLHIYNFISFLRGYVYDFKLITMKFPVNTVKQQKYLEKKIKECDNEIYYNFLKEKLDQLIFLEEKRQNKEFYIMIFVKENENKEEIENSLMRNQNIAVRLTNLDVEKKLKILFKLNNLNTKLS